MLDIIVPVSPRTNGCPEKPGAAQQQPDASNTITRTLFVSLAMIESTAIYCFVVSMILIFANPFTDLVAGPVAQSAGG